MMRVLNLSRIAGFLLAFAVASAPLSVRAVDGVIEINHAKALAGGVSASDTPGYPVTLDSSGSYRLTGSLTVPDANTSGITIGADDITIDLNGFSIAGPVVCSSAHPPVCSPSAGSGSGIEDDPLAPRFGLSVKGGTIRGMGLYGVLLGAGVVEGVRVVSNRTSGVRIVQSGRVTANIVEGNGETGILVGGGSTVSRNSVSGCGGSGISASGGAIVTDNVVVSNHAVGIYAASRALVSGNVSSGNAGDGIFVGEGSIHDNLVDGNGGHGIEVSGEGAVSRSTVTDSGSNGISIGSGQISENHVDGNAGAGIEVSGDHRVVGNTVRGNGGWGFTSGGFGAYGGNMFISNVSGDVLVSTSLPLTPNYCTGITPCP